MTKRKRAPEWHTLDFFCDDENSCALTALLPGARVHVIADKDNFDKRHNKGAEYWKLMQDLKHDAGNDSAKPAESLTSGDRDSGVDLSGDGAEIPTDGPGDVSHNAEVALQLWMLEPLLAVHNATGSSKSSLKHGSLQQWYHRTTQFYELSIAAKGERLQATQLEATPELGKQINDLMPSVTLPKTITDNKNLTTYYAGDLQVLRCSDQPPGTPYHPCRVRHRKTKQVYFFKVVDNSQPRTTKRELDVLGQTTRLKLNKQMHVPVLEGLVSFDDAEPTASGRKKIMGFLQTEIPNPIPLTHKLDPTIPRAKRDRWAKEAERMKNLLHEHDIVWGDAKADNFMVDQDENLWIIDFGGSYTEGWVDPDLNETEEGDDMGTTKTVNALQDPVANTFDPDEEEQNAAIGDSGSVVQKRKADGNADDVGEQNGLKRQRRSTP